MKLSKFVKTPLNSNLEKTLLEKLLLTFLNLRSGDYIELLSHTSDVSLILGCWQLR